MSAPVNDRIYSILLKDNLLNEDQIQFIQSKETSRRAKLLKMMSTNVRHDSLHQSFISLVDVIDSLGVCSDKLNGDPLTCEAIMEAIAKQLNLPFLKIDPLKLDSDVVTKVISRPYAIRHQMVPIDLSGNILTVATSNPFDPEGIDWIERTTDYKVSLAVATKEDIVKIITEFYGFKTAIAAAQKEIDSKNDIGNLEQYVRLKSITDLDATDKHIVNAVE